MLKKIVIFISAIIGISFGISLGQGIWETVNLKNSILNSLFINALIFGLLFMFLGYLLVPIIDRFTKRFVEWINRQTTSVVIIELIGVLLGIIIAYLVTLPFVSLEIPFISSTLPIILSILLAYVGYNLSASRHDEIVEGFKRLTSKDNPIFHFDKNKESHHVKDSQNKVYKLLDTSVIIDGRIIDILKTHFIEGTLLIPNFVLHELQLIADSSDSIKRSKGRRGLDILNTLQKDQTVDIEYYEGDFEDISEVDTKLVKLAKIKNAGIITNDYNLNKVSEFQNITVYNINELANALKAVYIPGEQITVQVIKEGTERKQGVAYLEDGTMIVVEEGQYHIGETVNVEVTSALQTAAGRMIFAKIIK